MRLVPKPPRRLLAPRARRRLLSVLGPDATSATHSLAALALNSTTSLVAGAMLGSLTGAFDRFPGLLVMVPAAIGVRGNIFSALGSRISTAIHTGEYRQSLRPGTVLGDNAVASMALTVVMAMGLAAFADLVSVAVGLKGSIDVFELMTISLLGGLLASMVVLVATVGLVTVAVRRSWDLDNLVAPVVSTLGDVVTVPALWLATLAAGPMLVSRVTGILAVGAGVGALVWSWRFGRTRLRRIMRESLPILGAAAFLSTMAGLVLEQQLDTFAQFPALLILVPAFVSSAGALGGLLSNSLATRLHLGVVTPAVVPPGVVRADLRLLATLALPVYLFNGAGAHLVAGWLGQASPGLLAMVGASLLGALGAIALALVVSYYGTIASVLLRTDPDTYGVPIVTSSVDFLGASMLVLAAGIVAI